MITEKLLATCSNKELVLVACEQLSMANCPHSYPLLLPLFDLSLPYNADWLAPTLLKGLTEGNICDKCISCHSDYSGAVIQCLSQLNTALCSKDNKSKFEKIILYVIDIDRVEAFSRDNIYRILANLNLDLSSILSQDCVRGEWDPRCLIVTSCIPERMPRVYNVSWLLSRVVPWVDMLVEDLGSFVETSDVRLILNTLIFFSFQNVMILSGDFERLNNILDFLITVAVNNQSSTNRQDASKSIRFISTKLSLVDRINLISKYSRHMNSSVAGLFIDLMRPILSQPRLQACRMQKLVTIIESLINFDNFDVLEISDTVLALLSIIQLCCRSPEIKNKVSSMLPEFEKYLDHVDRQTRRKEKDILIEINNLDEISVTNKDVPATISVQGEIIKEPTADEQRLSFQMACSRIDLILFNSATTRRVLESGSF